MGRLRAIELEAASEMRWSARVGEIRRSRGWYVFEREGFRTPNEFGYASDGYRLQIVTAGRPGYAPTLSGSTPCFPGDIATDGIPLSNRCRFHLMPACLAASASHAAAPADRSCNWGSSAHGEPGVVGHLSPGPVKSQPRLTPTAPFPDLGGAESVFGPPMWRMNCSFAHFASTSNSLSMARSFAALVNMFATHE